MKSSISPSFWLWGLSSSLRLSIISPNIALHPGDHPPASYRPNSLVSILMADKSNTNANTNIEPPTMTAEKSSSGFVKFCAFIDAIAKLLIAGALIGILVVLVKLHASIDNNIKGRESFSVRESGNAQTAIL
ncbi:hypothetical protein NXS19_013185 [Fusarium pseudograminearum]|nr:hypothetical protein NXS19_013185 [Fusarium pseudograminearum]